MCGIAGAVGIAEGRSRVEQANRLLAHRGPDAEGVAPVTVGGLPGWLGHRRLSIIDLSASANQPFHKNGYTLVFNGEIYNYKVLRRELQKQGVAFRTHSDTEVVLEAWRMWGNGALPKLRGMFAFALHNADRQELVLARDSFGIKPLFFWQSGGMLAFASELKGLLPLLPETPTISRIAMTASLLYCWIPESLCIYEGVQKLPPGSFIKFIDGKSSVPVQYWQAAEEVAQAARKTPTIEGLRNALTESIRMHMIADVPVSTFLSGGLDSSLITVLAKREAGQLDSYTIAFRNQDKRFEAMPDDLRYARQLAKSEDIRLHEIEVSPDISAMLPRMVEILDEPIGDSAAINTFLICQAAHEAGVKVLLSGMGADELFGGYRRHRASLFAARYRALLPGWFRACMRKGIEALPVAGSSRGFRTVRWAQRFLSFADLPDEAAYQRSYSYYDEASLAALIGGSIETDYAALRREHAAIYNDCRSVDAITRMCYTDTRLFMTGLNLAYSDRTSMAASTEVRVPFIDTEVARAAFAFPGNAKICGGEQKACLKQAAEAWLPTEIVYRPKASFTAPLRAWIRRDLASMVDDLLLNGYLVRDRYVECEALEKIVQDDRSGRADNAQAIWQLLTLEHWLRQKL